MKMTTINVNGILDNRIKKHNNTIFPYVGSSSSDFTDLTINGNMCSWSDRTSINSLTHRTTCADHFLYGQQGLGTSTFNLSRETDSPDSTVNYSIKLTVDASQSSVAAGDERHIRYAFEGIEINPYKNSYLTLKFYVKSNVVGSYTIAQTNSSRNQTFLAPYTISQPNVWEEKSIEIPLSTRLSDSGWQFGESQFGLGIRWALLAGSTYQGTANVWNASNVVGTSDQVNLASATGNYFCLSKVRVYPNRVEEIPNDLAYVGRSLQETKLLVNRYFRTFKIGTGGVNLWSGVGSAVPTSVNFDMALGTTMYRAPDVIARGTVNVDYALHELQTATNISSTGLSSFARSVDVAKWSLNALSGITAGRTYSHRLLTTSGWLVLDAEL